MVRLKHFRVWKKEEASCNPYMRCRSNMNDERNNGQCFQQCYFLNSSTYESGYTKYRKESESCGKCMHKRCCI